MRNAYGYLNRKSEKPVADNFPNEQLKKSFTGSVVKSENGSTRSQREEISRDRDFFSSVTAIGKQESQFLGDLGGFLRRGIVEKSSMGNI